MANLTIKEVAEKYDLKPDTLRYYERIGLLPKIPRQKNGNCYYTEGMQGLIFGILHMLMEPMLLKKFSAT